MLSCLFARCSFGWLSFGLLATVLRLSAAERVSDASIAGVRQLVDAGNFDYAIRYITLQIQAFPDDERLPRIRTQLIEAQARVTPSSQQSSAGGATVKPPRFPVRPPRVGQNFMLETPELAMVWIAPGSFWMDATHGSDDATHVRISRGFWLGSTEVTQEQWQVLMEHLPSPSWFKGSDRPVERVAWVNAIEFCQRLTASERAAGRLSEEFEYTLPTEAQWEFACRAGASGRFAGDLSDLAWHATNSGNRTHPVAQKKPNAWGFYDVHGNVAEWCLDGYGGYPGGEVNDPQRDHTGASAATFRIVRGGMWFSPAGLCSSAYRYWFNLNYNGAGVGFRVALVARAIVGTLAQAAGDSSRK